MRTFDLAATALHETFEGYRDLTELLEVWSEVDTAGIGTLTLEFDPYAVGGQRQHPRFTVDNTSGSTATVRLQSVLLSGHGYALVSVGMTMSARYRCSSGLAGSTVAAWRGPSGALDVVSTTVVADGEWHEFSGPITVFADNIFSNGLKLELSGIPNGATGTIDFDDLTLRWNDQIAASDSPGPTASMRADWDAGFRETVTFPTHVTRAKDGTEHRALARVVPRWRVEFTTVLGHPVDAAWFDAWLWAYHSARVYVPRWQDALHFDRIEQSNTWIWLMGGVTDDRWFVPSRRVMLWRAPDDFETVQVWQVGTDYVRLDVTINTVQGTWDQSTLVVPLVPGRLAPEVSIQRPNGRTGVVPLAFDLDLVP